MKFEKELENKVVHVTESWMWDEVIKLHSLKLNPKIDEHGRYGDNTAIKVNDDCYGSTGHFINHGFEVISFNQWKEVTKQITKQKNHFNPEAYHPEKIPEKYQQVGDKITEYFASEKGVEMWVWDDDIEDAYVDTVFIYNKNISNNLPVRLECVGCISHCAPKIDVRDQFKDTYPVCKNEVQFKHVIGYLSNGGELNVNQHIHRTMADENPFCDVVLGLYITSNGSREVHRYTKESTETKQISYSKFCELTKETPVEPEKKMEPMTAEELYKKEVKIITGVIGFVSAYTDINTVCVGATWFKISEVKSYQNENGDWVRPEVETTDEN